MKLDLPPELLQLLLERDIPHVLAKRNETSTEGIIIIVVIALLLVFAVLSLYFLLRHYRVRNARPRYIPTRYLRSKWRDWNPGIIKHRPPSSLHEDVRRRSHISLARSASPANEVVLRRLREGRGFDGLTSTGDDPGSSQPTTDAADIDRQTSTRSTITLPSYSASARPTEKILGVAGDRANMDIVLEFPETSTEEELRREAEMDSLYQIRQARRDQQSARRTERHLRRARREERDRGDRRAVAELDAQAARAREAAAANTRPDVLMAEHESRDAEWQRGRRVSSVAYASLGVARHDGSRVRSDSASEDSRPLLDCAAGMGAVSRSRVGSRGGSPAISDRRLRADSCTLPPRRGRDRNVSTSSLSRFTTPDAGDSDRSSGEFDVPTPFSNSRSRSGSPAYTEVDVHLTGRSGAASARASSGLRIDSTDLGTRPILAPGVEDAQAGVESGTDAEPDPPDYDNLSPRQGRDQQHRNPTEFDTAAGAHAQDYAQTTTGLEERGEAPPYESPVHNERGGAQLSSFSRLPSIRVTPFSPFAGDADDDRAAV